MANTGAGIGAFGAGFAKSLTDVLMGERERKRVETRRQEDRAYDVEKQKLSVMFPYMVENIENIDDDILAQEFPYHFGGKQGKTRATQMRSAMTPLIQGGMMDRGATLQPPIGTATQAAQPTVREEVATTERAALGEPAPLPSTPAVSPAAPALPQRMLMGVPMMTPEARAEREAQMGVTKLTAEMRARMKYVPEVEAMAGPMTPLQKQQFLLTGEFPNVTAGMRPQSIRGVLPDGTPAFGVFDPARQGYFDPETGDPLRGFRPLTSAATQTFGVDREAIAKSMFDKPFRDLSQPQATAVIREEQNQIQKESERRALGTGTGQFQAPIDVSEAQRTGLPTGTTSAQVAGQRIPSALERARFRNATNIQTQLTEIKGFIDKALPSQTELAGLTPGASNFVRRRLPQFRNAYADLESAINNIRASLTRTMQENVGTETERDAQRALSTLADFEGALFDPARGDTRESAQRRIDQTVNYLQQVISTLPPAPVVGAGSAAPGGAPGAGSRAIQDKQGNWVIATP